MSRTIRAAMAVACGAFVTVSVARAKVPLIPDPPSARTPRRGNLQGTIRPAKLVQSIRLVSRVRYKDTMPAVQFDRDTGRFVVKNLPGDQRYDLCLKLTDGREIEGIDLDFLEQRMQRLAAARRKELGLPPESTHAFSLDDAKLISRHVKNMRDFMEVRRPLYIRGHGKWATTLVELLRTREHYAGKGRLIWRVELWYWEYRHGGWERVLNQERLLRRQRVAPGEWRKTHIEYDPALSVYLDPKGASPDLQYQIPDKPDIRRGRPANTEPVQQVKPFVLGVGILPDDTINPNLDKIFDLDMKFDSTPIKK